jgi:hypothetical protein
MSNRKNWVPLIICDTMEIVTHERQGSDRLMEDDRAVILF